MRQRKADILHKTGGLCLGSRTAVEPNGSRVSASVTPSDHDYHLHIVELHNIGPTAAMTLAAFVALCSSVSNRPLQQQMVVLCSMGVGGNIAPVENLTETLQVAFDAGAKRVLLPMASVRDIPTIPGELFAKFQTSFYSDPVDAVFKAAGVQSECSRSAVGIGGRAVKLRSKVIGELLGFCQGKIRKIFEAHSIFYCDETWHADHDQQSAMVLGAVMCPYEKTREIADRIRETKAHHGLNADFEVKWTKVLQGKVGFYVALRDCFYEDDDRVASADDFANSTTSA